MHDIVPMNYAALHMQISYPLSNLQNNMSRKVLAEVRQFYTEKYMQ